MAGIKISELNELTSVDINDNDVLPIVDISADETKKIKVQNIKTVVNDSYSTSATDVYSCNYTNSNFQTNGTTLYNDTTGSTGTITLSETSANYNYLEIYYKSAHTAGLISSKVDVSLGTDNNVALMGMSSSSATTHMYMAVCIYTLSGTSLTPSNYREYNAYNNTVDATSNKINIFKVVGYK